MSLAFGVCGIPVYQPANGLAGTPNATLFGIPMVFAEQAPTLGDQGDIMLLDLSWYGIAEKGGSDGGIQMASSIHVKFKYDETCFRFTMRIAGQPLISSAVSPYRGTDSVSPFCAIADRA